MPAELWNGRRTPSAFAASPLTPVLSPEYRGEGVVFSPSRALRWPFSAGIAVLLGHCVLALQGGLGAEPAAEPQPVEIRQGGYVEKVDPRVDYQHRLPRVPPRAPAESLQGLHLIPGFRLEQVATEPLVASCVDLAFDENGRLYVAEMVAYAEGNTAKFGSPQSRVSLLEDTDGDGQFDKRTVFVDRLVWPTGVACFDGGVFIAAAPDLLYCKDTDGDGRADVREVVLTGFELTNPNAVPNSLRWGLDNRLHGMTSTAGGELQAVLWEKTSGQKIKPIQARGRDFSIQPRTGELRLESGGGQFGMAWDGWGRKFESSNSNPCDMVLYDERYLARNPYLAAPSPRSNIWKSGEAVFRTSPPEPWRVIRTEMRIGGNFSGPVEGGGSSIGYFTSACGLTIYEGDAWPAEFRGSGFVCEGAGNLVARMRFEPHGVGLNAYAWRTEPKVDFLTSDEVWFRPIQFAHGPDGNLYLADMYREVFEHPDAVPPSVKKYLDLTTGKDRGRIYRIVSETTGSRRGPVRLGPVPTEELVGLLAHDNLWHRTTASRLLFERQDRRAVASLVQLAAASPSPLGRMHALYALDGLGATPSEVVLARLNDAHPRVREHAVRLAEKVLQDSPALRERLYALAGDEDVRVRYQLAFTLGELPGAQATQALAAIVRRDGGDAWLRLAALSSCVGRAGALFALLATDPAWRATAEARIFLEQLAEQAGLQNRADQVAEVLQALDVFGNAEQATAQAAVRGLSKGLAAAKSPLLARLNAAGGSRAGQLLADMIEQSRLHAADAALPVAVRVEAIRSLATAPFSVAGPVLPPLLDSRQPQEVQVAAVQTLSRFQDAGVAQTLVDAWRGFTPKVRSEAAEAIFARSERLAVLLKALAEGQIQLHQLDPARIQFLLQHPDPQIRAAAQPLLGGAKLARRDEVVAAYREALDLPADRERGRAVFKKNCATCHRLEGVGFETGLPLNTVQNRGRDGLLLHILDPNREVQPAYQNYIVVTDDGLTATGVIAAETATSITLKRAEGETSTVLRANIEELANTGLSLMPEGLEKQVSKQEMADLIEYLLTVK